MTNNTKFLLLASLLLYVFLFFIKPVSTGGNAINLNSSASIFTTLTILTYLYFLILKNWDNKTKISFVFIITIFLSFLLSFARPIGSTDIYAYIPYGRIISHNHKNPYITTYAQLTNDVFYNKIDHPWIDKTTPYAPLFSHISGFVTYLGGNSYEFTLLLFRLLFSSAFVVSSFLVYKITKSSFSTAVFSLNPLVVFEFAQNGHSDVLTILFLLSSIFLLTRYKDLKHHLLGIVFFTFSVLIKYSTIFLTPVFIFFIIRKYKSLASVILPSLIGILVSILIVLPFWHGYSVFFKVLEYYKFQSIQASLGILIAAIPLKILRVKNPLWVSAILNKILFAAGILIIYFKSYKTINGKNFVFHLTITMALFLSTFFTWFMPWYVTIIIPLLALLSDDKNYTNKMILISSLVTFYGALNYIILD